MKQYTIRKAYPWTSDSDKDITIESENLLYSEANELAGVQCNSLANHDKIFEKCEEISKLIKEIEELNVPEKE